MAELVHQMNFRGAHHQPLTPILDLQDVCVTYHGKLAAETNHHALHHISFQAKPGEQIAVIGPNGAGKSTLFKLLAGMLKPDSGSINMFGHAPHEHICIAYVSQRSQIDWSFPVTVFDVVMMGRTRQIGLFRRPGKADRAIVQASLERVNALPLADKQIGELSGGQQQRIFIARALAQDAHLLLLDEPLTGLDIPSQEKLFECLAGLRASGVTVMIATHDLTLAAERFDRVILLNRKIIADGPAAAVLTSQTLIKAYGGQRVPHEPAA